jgi:hypothetical protein
MFSRSVPIQTAGGMFGVVADGWRWRSRTGRRAVGAAVVICFAAGVRASDAGAELRLAPGEKVFWPGQPAATCEAAVDPCFTYPLTLTDPGWRLRVAVDTASRGDSFKFELVDPSGAVAASRQNSNQFNEEAFVADPQAGAWTVRVLPSAGTQAPQQRLGSATPPFRMRAKLEAGPPTPAPAGTPLLPNLRTVPPLEFTFIAPLNPANGVYPPDTVNPPADAGGLHPISCTADEAAPVAAGGFAAQRCLRLTSGPINVGKGPYDMRFDLVGDSLAGNAEVTPEGGTIQRAQMQQVVHLSGGETYRRPAGTYSFHLTHAHFHDNNILTYQLWRVLDSEHGALEPAATGTKSGFCPADQLFGQWRRFSQMPSGDFGDGDTPTGNCFSPSEGFLGLTVGWGDVYRWQRPGQYVEFAGNGDGLYVVRSIVDKPGEVLEANETDNVSYAYIRVTGDQVEILERGRGRSPWDPHKVVFTGPGPASVS